ncbi:PAS domain-containing hybrid sensor histidine kinase/response regulator [Aquabacterium sp.]|uniref:hybrid sensor histidine kinase/response regulator n=1 Tax=Aquabacterium sp. TaxID=1872578 RepID=UPI002489D134|nr:PAS domain-containing hybrid sensor histidine kinase/response regulator [Aquabacterium sp.]MDI1261276.1 ATP-binding protein [Aquabacterium sp.]
MGDTLNDSREDALAALAAMTVELAELREELNETNTGVVALYAELDHQAEQLRLASERSESKFHTIYAQSPSGIVLLGDDGTVVGANPAMLKLLRRGMAEVVGQKLSSFSFPEWVAQLDGLSPQGGAEWQNQGVPMRLPGGGLVHLEWSVLSQIEPGIAMVLATDISERVALEHQRLQLLDSERVARGEAEQVSRMKDDFIAVLSHELRTPLNAIMGWTHVLMKRGGTDETMRGLAVIKRNGTTQARMISDLLDMSRLNMGKLPLSLSMLDPAQEIDAAISAMMPALEDKEIRLDVIVAPPYRPIQADASRLQQVVWNLLSNAIKFSPRGSTVSVSLLEVGTGLRILVTDSGQGISADFLPFVFDRFAQSDAASNRHRGGLGLGLSIAKQLVEAHGGVLSVRSEGLGHGATFEVWLPTDPWSLASSGLNAGDDELDVSAGSDDLPLRQLKILIVDDDPDAVAMLHIILGDRGATLRAASHVDQALEMVESFRPDVLISDIGMVGKDGHDLIRELRRRESLGLASAANPRLPAIALTSFARDSDRLQALEAGFDAHCPKPLRPLNLIQQIVSLLR